MMEQQIFDRSEAISEALHQQDGLSIALSRYLAEIPLLPEHEHVIQSLIDAQDQCRARARRLSEGLARSERVTV